MTSEDVLWYLAQRCSSKLVMTCELYAGALWAGQDCLAYANAGP